MMRNGKELRARLVTAWCEACGGCQTDAMMLGTAIELVHGASLIQDEIIDKTESRKGVTTLWRERSLEFAMLESDTLIGEAFEIITHVPIDNELKLLAIRELGQCLMIMANGAQNEFEGMKKDWQFIYRAKTAILFETACVFGVIAAGGSAEHMAQAREYGKNLGIAYQILNDMENNDGLVEVYGIEYARIFYEDFHRKYQALSNEQTRKVIE